LPVLPLGGISNGLHGYSAKAIELLASVLRTLARAESFDAVADLYNLARPTYPEALVADLIALMALPATHRVLEVGAGTGQLTASLARRGMRVTAIERGANLARLLAHNVAAFSNVSTIVADFDKWDVQADQFDAIVLATAFHWLDPSTRLLRCARLLRPGGALAIVDTRWGAGLQGERFAEESQKCYARWDKSYDPNRRAPALDEPPEFSAELESSGLFATTVHRRHFCRRAYDARGYCDLLATFSNILAFDRQSRIGFLQCIERLINENFGGRIVSTDVHDVWVARTPIRMDRVSSETVEGVDS
jgi:SAM-dependent methyltransferase